MVASQEPEGGQTPRPVFACAGIALLRAPVLPEAHAVVARCRAEPEASEEATRLVDFVRGLMADPLVSEAVAVSSPSLSGRLHRILEGKPQAVADLRRAAMALTRYHLRMTGRSTPFGLMAGVAVARFAEVPDVRLGTAHRKGVRPDRGWLAGVVTQWERRAEALAQLRVTANDLCFVRGDRLVVPYVPHDEGRRRDDGRQVSEVWVRYTPAVRMAVEQARTPVPGGQLQRALSQAWPRVPAGAVADMLVALVKRGILLTDLGPPLECEDPLQHIVDRLVSVAAAEITVAELRAIRQDLTAYAQHPCGWGRGALEAAQARMRVLNADDRPVQVDLALDAQVQLPQAVAEEAQRAADLLWRISPHRLRLEEYHAAFLQRYGVDRAVPVAELLNTDTGLGPPAQYRTHPSPDQDLVHNELDLGRDQVLAALAQHAVLHGEREIVLDAQDLAALTPEPATGATQDSVVPASTEVCFQLLADSVAALGSGDFRLVAPPLLVSPVATAVWGRFAYLLPDVACELGALAAQAVTDNPDLLPVQLACQVRRARHANVTQTPRWLEHTLAVGTFTDRSDPRVLPLDDIAVIADPEGLQVISLSRGRLVAPAAFHLLDPAHTPPAARLVCDIAADRVRPLRGWSWGMAQTWPYLPRVRSGRSVLASARWLVTDPALRDQTTPFSQWRDALEGWRERWRVPERVQLTVADHHIELNLTQPWHLRLLRHDLGRRERALLYELPAGGDYGTGWLTGINGSHANEIVFPLLRHPDCPTVATHTLPAPALLARHARPAEHLPGGEWLYAKLYSSFDRHTELLTDHLPQFIAALPPEVDRWFFLRYADPHPHLRLRLHADPLVLTRQVLSALHDLTAQLRRTGLISHLVLDTYDPELERYGGPEAIEAAERVFHTDSIAALTQLHLLGSGKLDCDPTLLAAANHADIADRFGDPDKPDSPGGGLTWLLTAFPKNEYHTAFQERRQHALRLIDPSTGWRCLREQPGGPTVMAVWDQRAQALTDYRQRLHDLGERSWSAPTMVLRSLLHLHHNRLAGTHREAEHDVSAIARGALEAHRNRARFTR